MAAVITSDETLVIETPERVPLHFALASIGNRFLACAIDHAIQVFSFALMLLALYLIASELRWDAQLTEAPKWVVAVGIVALFLIMTGYFAFFDWIWRGQTPGKRWLKLRVIRQDGRPITFFEASVRNILREREAEAPAFAQVFATSVSDPALRRSFKPTPFDADLSSLTEREIEVVEMFLRRRWDLS